MEFFWLILAFALGGFTGFVVFALMKMSQDARNERRDVTRRDVAYPAPQPFDSESDTTSRM